MDKISIIIPCYNVEKYVDRCLESVVNQTIGLENMEIIVVNDASTDGTLDKLYQWEKKFPDNIMVITYDENLRQGGARNLGMQYASGEYIGFVDSDDWIEPDMYELLYEKMSTGKYDLVKCKFIREAYKGQHPLSRENRRDVEYHFTPRNGVYYVRVEDTGNCGFYGGLWSGLYKKSMLVEQKISFPEHTAYEDNFFEGVVQLYIETLCIIDVVLYHYFTNPESTINSIDSLHHMERMPIEVMLVQEYKNRGAFEVWHDEIEIDFLERYFINTWFTFFVRFNYIPDIMNEMKRTIVDLFPNYKENPYLADNENLGCTLLKLLEKDDVQIEDVEKVKADFLAISDAKISMSEVRQSQMEIYRQLPEIKLAILNLYQNIRDDNMVRPEIIEKNREPFVDILCAYADLFSIPEIQRSSKAIRKRCKRANLSKTEQLELLADIVEAMEKLEEISRKRLFKCNVCKNDVFFMPFPKEYEEMRWRCGFPHMNAKFQLESKENWRCPICKAYDRERLMIAFLEDVQPEGDEKLRMLHVAPSFALEKYALNREDILYESLDLVMPNVTFQADLQDMSMISDEAYDIIVCSHVLEHVENDAKAMSELFRILKQNGVCLVLVPLIAGSKETDEEWGKSEVENWQRFGQGDHCRLYGTEDFIHRLQKAGFYVNEIGKEWFGEEFYQKYGFDDLSIMYVATKSLRLV